MDPEEGEGPDSGQVTLGSVDMDPEEVEAPEEDSAVWAGEGREVPDSLEDGEVSLHPEGEPSCPTLSREETRRSRPWSFLLPLAVEEGSLLPLPEAEEVPLPLLVSECRWDYRKFREFFVLNFFFFVLIFLKESSEQRAENKNEIIKLDEDP
jgi:hypothetical protein